MGRRGLSPSPSLGHTHLVGCHAVLSATAILFLQGISLEYRCLVKPLRLLWHVLQSKLCDFVAVLWQLFNVSLISGSLGLSCLPTLLREGLIISTENKVMIISSVASKIDTPYAFVRGSNSLGPTNHWDAFPSTLVFLGLQSVCYTWSSDDHLLCLCGVSQTVWLY